MFNKEQNFKVRMVGNHIIYIICFSLLTIGQLNANEITNRYLYDVGEEVSYKVDAIAPNDSSYVVSYRLVEVTDDQEVWEVVNSPREDKMMFHRITGNWIKSFKNSNETMRCSPYSVGLKFPLQEGDKWKHKCTFRVDSLALMGTSQAEWKVKKDTIKINNKTYETLQVAMKHPTWNFETDTSWKKEIYWIDIETGKTVQVTYKNTYLNLDYTSTLIE